MQKADISKKTIPTKSGVYFFLGARKEILYIGKATSLKHRIASYFDLHLGEKRSTLIEKMVNGARTIEWTVTDSVLEAMLLETNLIRTHKPEYNTRSRDDKSFNHVVITKDEFPRVLVVRGKDLVSQKNEDDYAKIYGPFPSGSLFREALKIIRKLFQFYDSELKPESQKNKMYKGKMDFNRQIGLYPDSCTKQEYAKTIKHIALFFEGKKEKILKDLEKQMLAYAKKEQFEEAQALKNKIFALKHIQDVSLLRDESRTYRDERNMRIEAYDVAHLQGDHMVGVMTVVEGGEVAKSEYRKFTITTVTDTNDTGALKEILERRLTHLEWPLPHILVVDGYVAQKNVAERVLRKASLHIPVVAVVKDERHKPKDILGAKNIVSKYTREILLANAESHRFAITFHRMKRRTHFG